MKITSTVTDLEIEGVSHQSNFQIKTTSKAFSILSSGLYSNKIKAVIRELSCNALDSHKAANKEDVPFEVHLPNRIEPFFSVKDFGVGLSHEDLTSIYTTYFESTKQDSNDYIGALGLGSKSPFSYTDNFSVISIKDNVKRIYTAYIAEHGAPSICLMSEESLNEFSEEQQGVEVRFSVNSEYDYRRFQTEAMEVFKWFKNKPLVIGNKDYVHEMIRYNESLSTDFLKVVGRGVNSYAVQGSIAYPLSLNSYEEFNDFRHIVNEGVILEFNIGELDVSASREELSYISLTKNSILEKLKDIDSKLKSYCEELLVNSGLTPWKQAWKADYLLQQNLYKPYITELIAKNKIKLLTGIDSFNKWDKRTHYKPLSYLNQGVEVSVYVKHYNFITPKLLRPEDIRGPLLTEDSVVVYNDTKRGHLSKIKELCQSKNSKRIILVTPLNFEQKEKGFYKFKKGLWNLDVHEYRTSLLSVKKKEKLVTPKDDSVRIYTCRESYRGDSYVMDLSSISLNSVQDTVYYFRTHSKSLVSEMFSTLSEMMTVIKSLKFLNYLDSINIYGISSSQEKEVLKNKNFVFIEDVLKQKIDSIDKTELISRCFTEHDVTSSDFIPSFVKSSTTIKDKLKDQSPFKLYLERCKKDKYPAYQEAQQAKLLANYLKVPINSVVKEESELKEQYTMFKVLKGWWMSYSDEDTLVEYINLVDEKMGIK